jgi:hypothetical protein
LFRFLFYCCVKKKPAVAGFLSRQSIGISCRLSNAPFRPKGMKNILKNRLPRWFRWLFALVVALPATVSFGPTAFLGFVFGLMGIISFLSARSRPDSMSWLLILSGLGGLLGLVGLWIRLLIDEDVLARHSTLARVTLALMLLCGSVSALWLTFLNGFSELFEAIVNKPAASWSVLLLLCLGVLGGVLALSTLIGRRGRAE